MSVVSNNFFSEGSLYLKGQGPLSMISMLYMWNHNSQGATCGPMASRLTSDLGYLLAEKFVDGSTTASARPFVSFCVVNKMYCYHP